MVVARIFLDILFVFVCLCLCDMCGQNPAYWASGAHPGHSPEHVWHGSEGGADPAAQHGQQQRYDLERTHAHAQPAHCSFTHLENL